MQNRQEVDQAIAYWEDQRRRADEILSHLRAILAAFGGTNSVPSPTANGHRATAGEVKPPANAFPPKYGKPAKSLVYKILRELDGDAAKAGLSQREVLDRLAQDGKEFSEQAVSLALKGLVKEGKIKKVAAPKSAAAKWHYRENPNYAEATPELAVTDL